MKASQRKTPPLASFSPLVTYVGSSQSSPLPVPSKSWKLFTKHLSTHYFMLEISIATQTLLFTTSFLLKFLFPQWVETQPTNFHPPGTLTTSPQSTVHSPWVCMGQPGTPLAGFPHRDSRAHLSWGVHFTSPFCSHFSVLSSAVHQFSTLLVIFISTPVTLKIMG